MKGLAGDRRRRRIIERWLNNCGDAKPFLPTSKGLVRSDSAACRNASGPGRWPSVAIFSYCRECACVWGPPPGLQLLVSTIVKLACRREKHGRTAVQCGPTADQAHCNGRCRRSVAVNCSKKGVTYRRTEPKAARISDHTLFL